MSSKTINANGVKNSSNVANTKLEKMNVMELAEFAVDNMTGEERVEHGLTTLLSCTTNDLEKVEYTKEQMVEIISDHLDYVRENGCGLLVVPVGIFAITSDGLVEIKPIK